MNHWVLCFQDVWSISRWVVPPALILFSGMYFNEPHYNAGSNGAALLFVGVVLYVAAMNGWWV